VREVLLVTRGSGSQLTLDENLDMTKMCECNECMVGISKAMGIPDLRKSELCVD
jgi:hypothetical protein